MAKFLFVSLGSWGHIDMGGQSFARSATELVKSNHEVWWTLAQERHPSAVAHLQTIGINYVRLAETLSLACFYPADDAIQSVDLLTKWIRDMGVDVLVVDRFCRHAGIAAHVAGIPWAAVGTDGRPWRLTRVESALFAEHRESERSAEPICKSFGVTAADACLATDWAISPYLNISFLPGIVYRDARNDSWPEHSHFVGCANEERPPSTTRNEVVISLGNTMDPQATNGLIRALFAMAHGSQLGDLEIVLLTGSQERTNEIGGTQQAHPRLSVKTWVPYREAFQRARLMIGHGGTGLTWEAIRNGVPLLSIAPNRADQRFLAEQMLQLGAGVTLEREEIEARLGETIATMLQSSEKSAGMRALQARALTGGGVRASVALWDALASQKTPIASCPLRPCCC